MIADKCHIQDLVRKYFLRPITNIDLTAKNPKMKKHGLNIKLLFADFLEKGTFCSEINI
jgi:hypothetical protein